MHQDVADRVANFCRRFKLSVPICEAPMAGSASVERSTEIVRAGGMAGFGAVLSQPDEIRSWVDALRATGDHPFQLNLWVPGAPPRRDPVREEAIRSFLSDWGPPVPESAGDTAMPDFAAQCDVVLALRPAIASSIMGLFPAPFVAELKEAGIAWFACATTLGEALAAQAAGADAIVAQGIEAGGHRGTFDPERAATVGIGLMALIPQLADRLSVPVVAAGGIADGRGIAAALALGASAVQIGTAFLAASESAAPWSSLFSDLSPEATVITRAFSGRPARAVENGFVRAAAAERAPRPAPYPVQRTLTAGLRDQALKIGDASRMQAWAGQAAGLASTGPAGDLVSSWWHDASRLLG